MAFSTYRVHYQLRAHKRDEFIEFIKTMLLTPFVMYGKKIDEEAGSQLHTSYAQVFRLVAELIDEHRLHVSQGRPSASKLKELVPAVKTFFTPLPLTSAFEMYDKKMSLSGRMYVPPSFNDIRHILSIAQILSIATEIKLATFDGDETLYSDGDNFDPHSEMVSHIIALLRSGVYVALVTAAGYKGDPKRYEERLQGLLDGFRQARLDTELTDKFFVMGGECNFLFRCTAGYKLEEVSSDQFQTEEQMQWPEEKITQLLDVAEASLKSGIERMGLPMEIYRKPRATGTIRPDMTYKPRREQLDELTLSCRHAIVAAETGLPFCSFNGGNDVWIDVGNKLLGVQALQRFLKCRAEETLHFGDQFLSTGNDISTRQCCSTVWVASPAETSWMLAILMEHRKNGGVLPAHTPPPVAAAAAATGGSENEHRDKKARI